MTACLSSRGSAIMKVGEDKQRVSWHRHRHFRGQGGIAGREGPYHRPGQLCPHRAAPAPALVRTGPGGLVERHPGRRARPARRSARAGGGGGPCRPDARRDSAGRGRSPAAPRDPVERWPQPCRMCGAGSRRSRSARHFGQYRDARLHRAQARLGARARARDLRRDAQRAAAQGLCPVADDRRKNQRHVR